MLKDYLIVLLWSMVPIVELRGAIPIGTIGLGLHMPSTYIVAVLGNLVPVPFIIKFIRPIFEFLQEKTPLKRLVAHYVDKANRNAERLKSIRCWVFSCLLQFPFLAQAPGQGRLLRHFWICVLKTHFHLSHWALPQQVLL